MHRPRTRDGRLRVVRLLALTAAAVALGAPCRAFAYDEDSAAVRANKGLHIGIGPVLLLPSRGGPLGGGLDLDLRFGIGADPVIVGLGGRLSGFFISGRLVGTAMPTLRITLPFGPLAPFVIGGVGGGWLSNPAENSLALLAGGGLMVHLGSFLAFGAEATYQTIAGTEFQELAIGPAIMISFLP